MLPSTSNIEPLARAICERDLRRGGAVSEDEMAACVDRYWHCVAASLEAGLADDSRERTVSHGAEQVIEAYRDWRERHPGYTPPVLPPSR